MHVHIQINSEYLNRGNQTNKGKECLYITTGKTVLAMTIFLFFFLDKYKGREKARCCDY
jgi:hypothetical protein